MTRTAFETNGLVARGSISFPDMTIPGDRTTFIVGESGTGKTTLLKIFNQTESQTSGTVHLFGSDVTGMHTAELRAAAILCGQNVFLFNSSVKENFNEFRRYAKLQPLPEEEMKRFLAICHAERDLGRQCRNLSGGERARVFISIHLSFMPAVLMLDEPTSALDRDTASAVMGNLKKHCAENGITMIVVSHDRGIVDAFADHVIDLGGKKDG